MSVARYFAYGSNMQTATLRGRRGIAFRRAVPARAAGWRLVFDKPPLLPGGNGFANIIPDAAAEVLGVVYELGEDDLARVELTEGVLIGNYASVTVSAASLAGDGAVWTARSLSSTKRDPRLRPSTRYMALLIEGAIEHGLPDDYVTWLRAVPAEEEGAAAQALRPVIDAALRKRW
jgi:hypothetical protein